MTNEELIARLKALAVDLPLAFHEGSLLDVDDVAVALNDAAVVLEAATVEAEWEYGTAHIDEPDCGDPVESQEEAERFVANYNRTSTSNGGFVVRRRKAGAWEPVGGDDA